MSDDERIHLGELDPSSDRARWRNMIESVVSRATARRRTRVTVTTQLATWARPALAIAFAVAMAVWVGAVTTAHRPPPRGTAEDPPASLTRWASGDSEPSAIEILGLYGSHLVRL